MAGRLIIPFLTLLVLGSCAFWGLTDVHEQGAVVLAGSGDEFLAAQVDGDTLYCLAAGFSDQANLTIVDIRDPSRPVLSASLSMPQRPKRLAVAEGVVATVSGDNTGIKQITLVDVTNPRSPAIAARIDFDGSDPWFVHLYRRTLYTATSIYDVSDPYGPVLVGPHGLGDAEWFDWWAAGPGARLALIESGPQVGYQATLVLIDLADPVHPRVTASLPLVGLGSVYGMTVGSHSIYLITEPELKFTIREIAVMESGDLVLTDLVVSPGVRDLPAWITVQDTTLYALYSQDFVPEGEILPWPKVMVFDLTSGLGQPSKQVELTGFRFARSLFASARTVALLWGRYTGPPTITTFSRDMFR